MGGLPDLFEAAVYYIRHIPRPYAGQNEHEPMIRTRYTQGLCPNLARR